MASRALWVMALTLVAAGCLPLPDVQVPLLLQEPSYQVDPALVQRDLRWIDTPAAPGTPDWLNRTGVRRSSLDDTPPRVVVVAMPGLFGGAAGFDALARQLVASEPALEVWAIDRRSNALEDREGIRRALAVGDPEIARSYYARAGAFTPLDPASVPFMAEWGLDVHLRDLHAVVLEARAVAERVVLAGHSLGAGLISVYPAYRIPNSLGGGIGADYVDGLILIDGSVGRTGALGRADDRVGAFGVTLVPSLDDLRSGRVAPFLRTGLGLGPEIFVDNTVRYLAARLRPDALAPDTRFPITNRALAGIRLDDHYALTPVFSASVGEAVGARFSGNLTAFVLSGPTAATSRSVVGVAPGSEVVDWSPGDPTREVSDLDDLLLAWTDPDMDAAEWYFPLRLAVDLAQLDPRLERAPGFVAMQRLDIPALAIGAGRGIVTAPSGFQAYVNTRPGAPVAVTVLPGLTHVDVLQAVANPGVPVMLRWLRSEGWLPPRPR